MDEAMYANLVEYVDTVGVNQTHARSITGHYLQPE